jgi:signal peptidase II
MAREPDRAGTVTLAALTAGVVLAIDQATKVVVRDRVLPGDSRDVLGSALRIVHVQNDGVAFGRLAGSAGLVGVIVAAAVFALLVYFVTHLDTPLVWLPTGLLLGGALGNVVDRLTRGTVTDFVKLPHWPAFNFADVCITGGVVVLLVVVERDARRRERLEGTADGTADLT